MAEILQKADTVPDRLRDLIVERAEGNPFYVEELIDVYKRQALAADPAGGLMDGQLKWEWPASTGIDSSPTAPGVFQIQSHEPNAYAGNWDLWMPSFMGIYRPVPTSEFMNGFHGFPRCV